jgi:hypothetical protein
MKNIVNLGTNHLHEDIFIELKDNTAILWLPHETDRVILEGLALEKLKEVLVNV